MRRGITKFLVIVMFIAYLPHPAISAVLPKIGSTCRIENQIKKNPSLSVTCTKKGKKLIWVESKVVKAKIKKEEISPDSIPPIQVVTPSEEVSQDPKPGKLCPSPGVEKQFGDRFYTCVNSGDVSRWSAGKIDVNYLYSTDEGFNHNMDGPCSLDYDTPEEWAEFERSWATFNGCLFPLRIKKYTLGKEIPKSNLTSPNQTVNINQCKIKMPGFGVMSNTKAFYDSNWYAYYATNYLKPKVTIQLIPIYAVDTAKPSKKPVDEYGKFLRYIKNWVEYASDVTSEVKIQIPDKYIEFPEAIKPFNVWHQSDENASFAAKIVSATDSAIDFSNVNIGIVVVPGGTPLDVIQQGRIGDFRTREGTIQNVSAQYPDTYGDPLSGTLKFAGLRSPGWWIHELYHLGLGLDDHYGDNKNDPNTEHGLGWWSLMTPGLGDMTIWEKWIIGFISDEQVRCVSPVGKTRYWLAPSSVSTKNLKTVIVPIDSKRVLVLESIRAAGLYYKNPSKAQGLLAYVIDMNKTEHGTGFTLVYPKNRVVDRPPYFMSGAALTQAESASYENIKFTVIESGNFGDVVELERVP